MDKFILKLQDKARRVLGWAFWLLIAIFLISVINNINKIGRVHTELNKETEQIALMREENTKLEAQVALVTSNEYIEKQIRDKLGLVKNGEIVIVLPDREILKKLAPQAQDEASFFPDPNWKKWLKLFI